MDIAKLVGVAVAWRLFLVVFAGLLYNGLEIRKPEIVIGGFVRLCEAWESLGVAHLGLDGKTHCLRS